MLSQPELEAGGKHVQLKDGKLRYLWLLIRYGIKVKYLGLKMSLKNSWKMASTVFKIDLSLT